MLTFVKRHDKLNLVLKKQLHRKAQIAQSVEQGTENPCVAGSIPALGILSKFNIYYAGVVQW